MQVPVEVVLLNPGVLEAKLKQTGVKVTILDESRLNGFQIFYQLYRLIKSYQPEVIHTHRTKENILGSLAALFAGNTATVRTVHGDREHDASWWHLARNGIQLMDMLTGRFLQKRIIAVSDDLASILIERYPARKIRVIRNGVNCSDTPRLTRGARRTRGIAQEQFRIGLAGRLVPVKRVDILLDTVQYLKIYHTGLNLEFRIFGDGSLRRELEQQCIDKGIKNSVRFYGHVNDLTSELQKLDALIMTSDHEGLPMVLLEAMVLGVTVIAHAVGGVPDLLDKGKCGILVHEHSARGYAEAIQSLTSNPKQHAILSENAVRRVTLMYSAEENASNYLAEYQTINV